MIKMEIHSVLHSCFILTFSLLVSEVISQTQTFSCPERCTCKLVPNPRIDCSKANFHRIPESLSQLKGQIIDELDFSNNKNLKTLQNGAFEGLNISVLKLSSTSITHLSAGVFSGVVAINTLYLDKNRIVYSKDENPLSGLEKSLEYLQLRHQNLQEIPHFIKSMLSLIEVDLSDNNIRELSDKSLAMIRAKRIILQRNHMHTISKSALVSTKPKELVDLSQNQITDISFLWDYCKVDRVDLTGNPIYCHCDLVVYRKAMVHPQVIGMCSSPTKLRGLSIMTEDFVTTASRVCRVGGVRPITCPAPHYRANIYTAEGGTGVRGDLAQSMIQFNSGSSTQHGLVVLPGLTAAIVTVLLNLIHRLL